MIKYQRSMPFSKRREAKGAVCGREHVVPSLRALPSVCFLSLQTSVFVATVANKYRNPTSADGSHETRAGTSGSLQ